MVSGIRSIDLTQTDMFRMALTLSFENRSILSYFVFADTII